MLKHFSRVIHKTFSSFAVAAACACVMLACDTGSKGTPPAPTATPSPSPSPSPASGSGSGSEGVLRLGTPIEASAQKVALSDVAKAPSSFVGKTFATTGTVTAVCQHMGCWMEIKDDASEAHIKMAGHAFFVPKTASGHKARVLAKLVNVEPEGACDGEGHEGMSAAAASEPAKAGAPAAVKAAKGKGCRAEAEAQLGRPLAKLELVAEGVELL